MALAPTATAAPADDLGAPAPDDTAPADTGDTVLVTVCKSADGTYTVYHGDEPEEGEGDGGGDTGGDETAGGVGAAAGAGPDEMAGGAEADTSETAPQGEHYDTVSAALHAVMTILHDDENGGAGGAERQLQSGYDGDTGGQAGAVPLAQKY